MDQNCNNSYEEEVDLNDNYDHFLQLRANKKIDEIRRKCPLQVDIPAEQPEVSLTMKTPSIASSCLPKIRTLEWDKTFSGPIHR